MSTSCAAVGRLPDVPPSATRVSGTSFVSHSSQKRHLRAESWISSAQKGQSFMSGPRVNRQFDSARSAPLRAGVPEDRERDYRADDAKHETCDGHPFAARSLVRFVQADASEDQSEDAEQWDEDPEDAQNETGNRHPVGPRRRVHRRADD